MPRASKVEETAPEQPIRWGRFTAWLVLGVTLMLGAIFAWHRTEEFLIKDDRFRIPEAEDFAGESPNLSVQGVHYASPAQIRHVFAEDFGRSLYLAPIQRRRSELLAIDWVEDATVSKVWPNALSVQIEERRPVAFVRLPTSGSDGMSGFALIDKDGYILRPRIASRFTLPVIAGIRESEPLIDRRARVHRVLGMLHELGYLGDHISEVDASDVNNLIASERVGSDVVNLMLGDEHYTDRMKNFLAHYAEIKASRPDTKVLDLRVDGVITAVGDETHEQ